MNDNFADSDDPYRYAHQSPIGDINPPNQQGGTDAGTPSSGAPPGYHYEITPDGEGVITVKNSGRGGGPGGGIPFWHSIVKTVVTTLPAWFSALTGNHNSEPPPPNNVLPFDPTAEPPNPFNGSLAGALQGFMQPVNSSGNSQPVLIPHQVSKNNAVLTILMIVGLIVIAYYLYEKNKHKEKEKD